jgi:23S rRNA (guanosine2251-2'-O)-methyltransferase
MRTFVSVQGISKTAQLKVRKLYHFREVNQLQKGCTIMRMESEKIVIIDNVRSAHNVGSIFRTSDGAGVSRVILVGYTPAPIDRFGRPQPEITKTSLGACDMISWEQHDNGAPVLSCIEGLKKDGFTIVAVEQAHNSVSLYDFIVPNKVAYIVGNEIDGVSQELLSVADALVEIPMLGKKESLNVGVTLGIVLFKK